MKIKIRAWCTDNLRCFKLAGRVDARLKNNKVIKWIVLNYKHLEINDRGHAISN